MIAEAAAPLTAAQFQTLLVVLAGVAVLMVAIRIVGSILAAGHPAPPVKTAPAAGQPAGATGRFSGIDPELIAVIAAATATVVKEPHRIVAVGVPKAQNVESLMQVWSWEGRRQIYSSHRVR